MQLRDSKLLRSQCYVNGQWLDAADGRSTPVLNPATGATLGTVPQLDGAATRRAIDAAAAAFPAWAAQTAKQRAVILRRWFELMMANQKDLGAAHDGRAGQAPGGGKRGNRLRRGVRRVVRAKKRGASTARSYPGHQADKRIVVLRQPVGVVAAITPWNFPAAMITRKAAPALAAGCTFIVKPAGQTPLSALAMAELAARAGVPPGVFNVVTGNAREIGAELTSSPVVRKLSFTGSTEVGRVLDGAVRPTLKKLSMELGGNAPFIVFADADLDAAVQGALASKYRNTGQTCVCANRLLVQEEIYDEFAARLLKAVSALKVGVNARRGRPTRGRSSTPRHSRRCRSMSPMPEPRARRSRSAASRIRWAEPSTSRPS